MGEQWRSGNEVVYENKILPEIEHVNIILNKLFILL